MECLSFKHAKPAPLIDSYTIHIDLPVTFPAPLCSLLDHSNHYISNSLSFSLSRPTMAVVSGSTGQNNPTGDDKQTEAEEAGGGCVFDMISLGDHLPQKRKGLSAYFSCKSRSFMCVVDAKCIDDLKKEGVPEAKRRKYTEGQAQVPSVFSRRAPSSFSHRCGAGVMG